MSVIDTNERGKILSEKKLCFKYTKGKHRASECKNEQTCRICNRKYYTSICGKEKGLLLSKK